MDERKILKLLEEIKTNGSGKQVQIYQLIASVLQLVKDKTDSQIAHVIEKAQAQIQRLIMYQAKVVSAAYEGVSLMEQPEVSAQDICSQLKFLTETVINNAEDVVINYEKPKKQKRGKKKQA